MEPMTQTSWSVAAGVERVNGDGMATALSASLVLAPRAFLPCRFPPGGAAPARSRAGRGAIPVWRGRWVRARLRHTGQRWRGINGGAGVTGGGAWWSMVWSRPGWLALGVTVLVARGSGVVVG